MASLKSIASSAIGLKRGFSIIKDFFGYRYYDSTQTFVAPLSLKRQIKLVKGKSIHLSIILVGFNGSFSGSVITKAQVRNIQSAIQRMRDLYEQASLGIRKIYWSWISVDDAGGYIDIADGDEATDLTNDWKGANDGIDVFFVQTIGDAAGWSKTDGPCDKESNCDRSGAVIELLRDNLTPHGADFFGIIVAHEVGHYLGLKGGVGTTNLMGADVNPPDGTDETSTASTNINSSQASKMRSGCFVKNAL